MPRSTGKVSAGAGLIHQPDKYMSKRAFEQAIREYGDYARDEKNWSVNTRRRYRLRAEAAERWLREQGHPSLVWADVDQLRAYRDSSPPSAVNRNDIRICLSAFFDFCIFKGWRPDNPAQSLPTLPTIKSLPRWHEAETTRRIEHMAELHADPMADVAIKLFSRSGLRKSECRLLRWSQITDDYNYFRTMGKGSIEREMWIHPDLRDALKRWRFASNSADWVLPSPKFPDRSISSTYLANLVREVGEMAGVPNLNPHSLRHSVAQELLENGNDIVTVQHVLGHASLETTSRYLRARDPRVREALSGLDYKHEVTT